MIGELELAYLTRKQAADLGGQHSELRASRASSGASILPSTRTSRAQRRGKKGYEG